MLSNYSLLISSTDRSGKPDTYWYNILDIHPRNMLYIVSYSKGGLLYQGEYIIDFASPLKAISSYCTVPLSTDVGLILKHVPTLILVGK